MKTWIRANLVLVINLILAVVKVIVGSEAPELSFNTKIGSGARRSPRAWKLRGLYPPGVPVLTRDRGGEFRKLDVLTRTVLHPRRCCAVCGVWDISRCRCRYQFLAIYVLCIAMALF